MFCCLAWILLSSLGMVQDFCSLCVLPEAQKAQERAGDEEQPQHRHLCDHSQEAHLNSGEAEQTHTVFNACFSPLCAFSLWLSVIV